MNLRALLVPCIALCSLLSTQYILAEESQEDQPPRVLVEINGKPVNELHFAIYRGQHPQHKDAQDPQVQVNMLNELVNAMMIAQAAESEGLDKHPEIIAAMEIAKAKLLAQAAIQHRLTTAAITEQQIQDAYTKQYASADLTEYKARHILLDTEEDAKDVIQLLENGSNFADLAKVRSKGPSGTSGGDLGWFEPSKMVAPFSEAVTKLHRNSITTSPVKTQFGWHVILLEDSRKAEPPGIDAVRDEITADLKRQVASDYIREIRGKTDIQIKASE